VACARVGALLEIMWMAAHQRREKKSESFIRASRLVARGHLSRVSF